MIDDGLGIIRKLWDAGLAHRDIKPANLLVRDGRLLLIDVAFVEARPSPWRQAVDLANMMLCLALRSSPELVYERALRQFTVEEITEGFAAARGLALPSQLRHMLRAQGRNLHAEFVRLLPSPPQPIRVQRWSARRVGLWALILALVVLVALNPRVFFDNKEAVADAAEHQQPRLHRSGAAVAAGPGGAVGVAGAVRAVPAGRLECRRGGGQQRPVGDHPGPRPGRRPRPGGAADRRLRPERGGRGAVSDHGRAALPADRVAHRRSSPPIWYDRFPGGCVTSRLHLTTDPNGEFAAQAPQVLGFTTRAALRRHSASARTDDSSSTPKRHDEPARRWRGRR